jgi:hypothetical protein
MGKLEFHRRLRVPEHSASDVKPEVQQDGRKLPSIAKSEKRTLKSANVREDTVQDVGDADKFDESIDQCGSVLLLTGKAEIIFRKLARTIDET